MALSVSVACLLQFTRVVLDERSVEVGSCHFKPRREIHIVHTLYAYFAFARWRVNKTAITYVDADV